MTETASHEPQSPTTPFGEAPSEATLSEMIRFEVKVFAAEDASVEPDEMIPVFHRWIQSGHLDDLLIDVADYCHVPEGPGVVLVAHDAHYAFDRQHGRPGLLYSRRRETHASLQGLETIEDRLASVLRSALAVCRKLESESSLAGRLRFRGDEMVLRVNDRLRAPNTDAAADALRPALEAVLGRLYPGVGFEIEREGESRDLLTLRIRARRSVPVAVLLGRLGGASSSTGGSANGGGASSAGA